MVSSVEKQEVENLVTVLGPVGLAGGHHRASSTRRHRLPVRCPSCPLPSFPLSFVSSDFLYFALPDFTFLSSVIYDICLPYSMPGTNQAPKPL